MSASKNLYNKKTSFLSKSNSEFIEQMYLKFIKKDPQLPKSWKDYFLELNEDSNIIINEINGPSWHKNQKVNLHNINKENISFDSKNDNGQDTEKLKKDSIRAVTLIRAYRTQGNLLAKLDPLGLKNTDYIDELHPSYHGF